MSQPQYINLPVGYQAAFDSNLTIQDRFVNGRVSNKVTLISKQRLSSLALRSYLPIIGALWRLLTVSEVNAWKAAGVLNGLTGYRLFVQEMSIRLKYGFIEVPIPSQLHQSWVGHLGISGAATEIKIYQNHPVSYPVYRKVVGKKSQYEAVQVSEAFSLPLVLNINYKSNLVASGPNPYAKFYADVVQSYQGVNEHNLCEINFELVNDWVGRAATISSARGQFVGYTLYFWLRDVTGDLFFDNVKATHSGQNWVRDTYCKRIEQDFTRAFAEVPKHWAKLVKPVGAVYNSIYQEFET